MYYFSRRNIGFLFFIFLILISSVHCSVLKNRKKKEPTLPPIEKMDEQQQEEFHFSKTKFTAWQARKMNSMAHKILNYRKERKKMKGKDLKRKEKRRYKRYYRKEYKLMKKMEKYHRKVNFKNQTREVRQRMRRNARKSERRRKGKHPLPFWQRWFVK